MNVIVTLAAGSGPPVQVTLPAPMPGRATSAVCTAAAVALNAIAAVVWLLKVSVKLPPVGTPLTDRVWTSLMIVPVVVCAIAGAGVVPPVRLLLATVIAGCAANASLPPNAMITLAAGSGPPLQTTLPAPIPVSAASAACTAAAVALNAMAAVVWPAKVSAKVPPVGAPLTDSAWTSLARGATASTGTTRA